MDITKITLKNLAAKISIVKDDLWSVYSEEKPLFTGTLQDCCDWINAHKKTNSKIIDPNYYSKNI